MSILTTIKAHKVAEVARLKARGAHSDLEMVCRHRPPPRDFVATIDARYAADEIALIAEIKKASPSRGLIREDFNVSEIASAYRNGGATCLSVLTDEKFFLGCGDDIALASVASELPVLRKDFLIDPIQVVEARAMGADCVLLILAMIDDGQAQELEAVAMELGLGVLIEVHDDAELDRAHAMQSRLIGINNRNLTTFKSDLGVSVRLASRVGPERLVVSESGIDGAGDVARLLDCGIRGFLVGESLLNFSNIEAATREMSARY